MNHWIGWGSTFKGGTLCLPREIKYKDLSTLYFSDSCKIEYEGTEAQFLEGSGYTTLNGSENWITFNATYPY